ncbi:MAG: hypothetical protein OXP09_21370 [Gammaproteobacteria bacterium]|nr:hypothetical protein [Gammaproteobacteria bacterium]
MHLRDDKFLISCAARSGSTMLCTLIGSHPQVLCHHEVFAQGGPATVFGAYARRRKTDPGFERRLRDYRDREPKTFLYDIVFNPQGRRCVGFKLKTDEVFLPAYKTVREAVAADTDIRVIHLIRRNLIDQYVSHRVVEKTGVLFLRRKEERPRVAPFTVDIEHFLAFIDDVKGRQRAASRLYGRHRNFTIAYEDIVAPGSTSLDDLQAFLEIDNRPLASNTNKILKNNRQLVLNLAEVEAVWAEHGHDLHESRPVGHGASEIR